jgi:hypothetical protein
VAITGSLVTTISGADAWDRRIANVAKLPAIVQHYGELIAATARELAPVDTGGLVASIKAVLQGWAVKISAGEGLPDGRAVFQEMGFHHWISGAFIINSYLRPAVEQNIAAFFQAVKAALV